MDALRARISEMEASKEAFHQNKIYKKAAAQDTYEKLCHLQAL